MRTWIKGRWRTAMTKKWNRDSNRRGQGPLLSTVGTKGRLRSFQDLEAHGGGPAGPRFRPAMSRRRRARGESPQVRGGAGLGAPERARTAANCQGRGEGPRGGGTIGGRPTGSKQKDRISPPSSCLEPQPSH